MFWQSILAGTAVLLSWKIWAALLLYIFVNYVVLLIGAALFNAGESGSRTAGASGCLYMMIGQPLLQGILMSFFVTLMLPVMLGFPDVTPLSDVLAMGWPITKAGIMATVAVILLCLIPVVGGLIANSTGIQTFIIGAIIFRLFFAAVEQQLPVGTSQSIFPSFWDCLGYLAISAALVWLLTMLGALVISWFESQQHDSVSTGLAVICGPLFGILGGFLPLFMYVQYVKLAVRAGVAQ